MDKQVLYCKEHPLFIFFRRFAFSFALICVFNKDIPGRKGG